MTQEEVDEEESANQRRLLRRKQRELQEDVSNVRAQIINLESGKFDIARNRLNELFAHVHHPREQQNDALTFKELSFAAKAQSANMIDSAITFDPDSAFHTIRGRFTDQNDHISWTKLGDELASISTGAAAVETMVGPMAKEAKIRKAIVRAVKDRELAGLSAEKPEEMEQGEDDADEATNERLKKLLDVIMETTLENEDERHTLDLLKLLVDPADNVQTIENFFDYAFLVKVGVQCENFHAEVKHALITSSKPNCMGMNYQYSG